ncbi:hypothetical protein BBP40_010015 [Aspergillus hancockii]|nr:hypothetical protein BBP40_010015 [Aspergillus hancockii]
MAAQKPPPTDLPTHTFSSARAFESFLDRHHKTSPGIYLKLAKKSSGIASISAADAVETALCFGWIDGRANAFDQDYWLVRYTPRRAKSLWSQKNVSTVERLFEEGRMRPAGIAAIEAAKGDGRWERAYAGAATMTVPEDFAAAMAAVPAAAAFFEGLTRTARYSVLWRVQTAPVQSRAKRIETTVQMLVEGTWPGAGEPGNVRSRATADSKARIEKASAPAKSKSTPRKRTTTPPGRDDEAKQPRREGLRPRRPII